MCTFCRVYVSVHSVLQANPLPVGLVLATKLWIYVTTAGWLIPSILSNVVLLVKYLYIYYFLGKRCMHACWDELKAT